MCCYCPDEVVWLLLIQCNVASFNRVEHDWNCDRKSRTGCAYVHCFCNCCNFFLGSFIFVSRTNDMIGALKSLLPQRKSRKPLPGPDEPL